MASSSSKLWSDLPKDLLMLIFEDLTDFFDLLRCRTVCHSWRSTANQVSHNITTPLLLLPPKQTPSPEYAKLVTASKVYSIYSPNSLARTRCLSSYHGWLLMADIEDPCKVYPYNPVSKEHVQLPSLLERDYLTPLRFMTSCNPDDPDCSFLILYDHLGSHNGCVCKPRDKKWQKIFIDMSWYDDMIFYDGELYAIDKHGILKRLMYNSFYVEEKEVPILVTYGGSGPPRYLAEWFSGQLVMVVRHVESMNRTHSFNVFKLDWNKGVWKEMSSLGHQALLLGHNDSVFVPGGNTYRPNCIYFVDDLWVGDSNSHSHDYGVYELENHKIKHFYQFNQIINAVSFSRWLRLH